MCKKIYRRSPSGPESVGEQHRHYFNTIARNEMPTRAFWVDLSHQVRMWITDGEGIVLSGDTNMNLRSDAARSQIVSMGLRDAIEPFITEGLSFNTYDRGSTVIDGAWVSCDIRVRSGGYYPFGKGLPTYHICS
jgi:hypothetical protein